MSEFVEIVKPTGVDLRQSNAITFTTKGEDGKTYKISVFTNHKDSDKNLTGIFDRSDVIEVKDENGNLINAKLDNNTVNLLKQLDGKSKAEVNDLFMTATKKHTTVGDILGNKNNERTKLNDIFTQDTTTTSGNRYEATNKELAELQNRYSYIINEMRNTQVHISILKEKMQIEQIMANQNMQLQSLNPFLGLQQSFMANGFMNAAAAIPNVGMPYPTGYRSNTSMELMQVLNYNKKLANELEKVKAEISAKEASVNNLFNINYEKQTPVRQENPNNNVFVLAGTPENEDATCTCEKGQATNLTVSFEANLPKKENEQKDPKAETKQVETKATTEKEAPKQTTTADNNKKSNEITDKAKAYAALDLQVKELQRALGENTGAVSNAEIEKIIKELKQYNGKNITAEDITRMQSMLDEAKEKIDLMQTASIIPNDTVENVQAEEVEPNEPSDEGLTILWNETQAQQKAKDTPFEPNEPSDEGLTILWNETQAQQDKKAENTETTQKTRGPIVTATDNAEVPLTDEDITAIKEEYSEIDTEITSLLFEIDALDHTPNKVKYDLMSKLEKIQGKIQQASNSGNIDYDTYTQLTEDYENLRAEVENTKDTEYTNENQEKESVDANWVAKNIEIKNGQVYGFSNIDKFNVSKVLTEYDSALFGKRSLPEDILNDDDMTYNEKCDKIEALIDYLEESANYYGYQYDKSYEGTNEIKKLRWQFGKIDSRIDQIYPKDFNHKLEEQKTIEQILKLAQEIENRKNKKVQTTMDIYMTKTTKEIMKFFNIN